MKLKRRLLFAAGGWLSLSVSTTGLVLLDHDDTFEIKASLLKVCSFGLDLHHCSLNLGSKAAANTNASLIS